MTTVKLTIDTANSNPLNGKSVEVTFDEKELNQDTLQDIYMDALAELESGNEESYHNWQQHGCYFKIEKMTTQNYNYKGVAFTIDSYVAPGGRGAHHIANGVINGTMVSKSSAIKKNLKRSFQRRIEAFKIASHLVITEPNANNAEAFIVSNSEFVNRYQLNPGVSKLFEGTVSECIAFCKSLIKAAD